MKFGDVVEENGKKVFKEIFGEDFVMLNYEYINVGGVLVDIVLFNFKKKGNIIFDKVFQIGLGIREKIYGSIKELSFIQIYKVGEDKIMLKDEL